jgi:hypothetical protein
MSKMQTPVVWQKVALQTQKTLNIQGFSGSFAAFLIAVDRLEHENRFFTVYFRFCDVRRFEFG